jgi:hypothetical protein
MKIIKLTESDLKHIVEKVLTEQRAVPSAERGQKNEDTKKIQQALRLKGYDLGTTGPNGDGVDGDFGPATQRAVKDFQKRMKLSPSGVVDQQTRNYLFAGFANTQFLSTLPGRTTPQKSTGAKTTGTKASTTGTKASTTAAKTVAKTGGSLSSVAKNIAKKETGTDSVLNPNATLFFDGDKVYWLTDGKVIKKWNAVSGLTWKNTPPSDWGQMLKRYTTSPQEWSKDKNAGPLPEGGYVVGPLETRDGNQEEIGALEAFWDKLTGKVSDNDADRAFGKNTLLSRISWGNYRAFIKPTGNQQMYGRGSFYIHGGSLRGSHGCIDLTDEMADFAKFFGIWSSATKKKTIPLNVKYKTPLLNKVIQKLVNL